MKITGFDFNNTAIFPKLENALNAIRGRIKASGRGEKDRFKEIPKDTVTAIFELCKKLETLLEARKAKDVPLYQSALLEIPYEWQNKYHTLTRMIVQFIVALFDCRRGREGIQELRKSHFRKMSKGNLTFFQKVTISTLVEILFKNILPSTFVEI